MTLYEPLRDALRAEEAVALATVVELSDEALFGAVGVRLGAKLLVRPDGAPLGSLGNDDIDRVVTRDARAAPFRSPGRVPIWPRLRAGWRNATPRARCSRGR